jgi:hypothetical protein
LTSTLEFVCIYANKSVKGETVANVLEKINHLAISLLTFFFLIIILLISQGNYCKKNLLMEENTVIIPSNTRARLGELLLPFLISLANFFNDNGDDNLYFYSQQLAWLIISALDYRNDRFLKFLRYI